ncbi:8990_t:CDS:2, partial [Racocetra persica]
NARRFDIQPKQVRSYLPCLEYELYNWIMSLQKNVQAVTRRNVTIKAKSLAKNQQYRDLYPQIQDFQFSNKWLNGFMNRKHLFNHRHTNLTQYLPEELNEKQQKFFKFHIISSNSIRL